MQGDKAALTLAARCMQRRDVDAVPLGMPLGGDVVTGAFRALLGASVARSA